MLLFGLFFFLNVSTIIWLESFGFFDNMRLFPLLYEICVKLALETVNQRNSSKSPIDAETSKRKFRIRHHGGVKQICDVTLHVLRLIKNKYAFVRTSEPWQWVRWRDRDFVFLLSIGLRFRHVSCAAASRSKPVRPSINRIFRCTMQSDVPVASYRHSSLDVSRGTRKTMSFPTTRRGHNPSCYGSCCRASVYLPTGLRHNHVVCA